MLPSMAHCQAFRILSGQTTIDGTPYPPRGTRMAALWIESWKQSPGLIGQHIADIIVVKD